MGKTDRVKQRTRKGKRKYQGNQWDLPNCCRRSQNQVVEEISDRLSVPEEENPVPIPTASSSKVQAIVTDSPKQSDRDITGYRFVDMDLLTPVIALLCCPECQTANTLHLHESMKEKMGFASLLTITCQICTFKHEFYSSKQHLKSFDINRRVVYAMRSIGQGYSSIVKFTALINMPSPMTEKNYQKTVKKVTSVVVKVAKETMKEAATEEALKKGSNGNGVTDIAVSCDGTWQRRGFASLNGVFTTIALDNGKVIDCEVMSRYCKACKTNEKLKTTDRYTYDIWFDKHKMKCHLNHVGSAGAMEVTGAQRIFSRSIENYSLRYYKFLGDGDSKSYPSVQNIYDGIEIEKLECVGHVQKRVGNRLLNLKKNVKGLGGRGNLTKAQIDRLQNYFGIAVRSNVGDLKEMQKAVRACLFHVASSSKNNYHNAYCPTGETSWCKYQRDKALGTSDYKAGKGLPLKVIKHVKPIFEDLSKESLLQKCLHGQTQNRNESFNSLIWERLPKSTYVSLNQLRLGSYDAIAHFNIGKQSSIRIFKQLNMEPGRYMTKQCSSLNRKRLFRSSYGAKESVKKRRKIIRGLKKTGMDQTDEIEGEVYKAGEYV